MFSWMMTMMKTRTFILVSLSLVSIHCKHCKVRSSFSLTKHTIIGREEGALLAAEDQGRQ
jgi:hypothetical protein